MGYFTEIKQFLTISRRNFGGRKNITNLNQANQLLLDMIESGKPLSVIRLGFAELDLLYEYEQNLNTGKHSYANNNSIKMISVLDNNTANIDRYADIIHDAYKNSDIIANWYCSKKEGDLLRKYTNKAALVSNRILVPFFNEVKWTKALKGKKVLVIHPFTNTIASQYKNRLNLFSDHDVLPEFDLIALKSVWYSSTDKDSRFKSWFEAVDFMKSEVNKIDFDIALLGCGTIGVPLTDYIKSIGKQAIYVGGVLQIYFGIKGGRWDQDSNYRKLYNEHWVRPNGEYKPSNYKTIDKGCYW